MSIRIVYIAELDHEPEYRIRALQPRVDDEEDKHRLAPRFKLYRTFEENIEQALERHSYSADTRLDVKWLNRDAHQHLRSISLECLERFTVFVHELGEYENDKVYAVLCADCSIRMPEHALKDSVIYRPDTLEDWEERCADLQFFSEFLKPALFELKRK